MYLSINITSNLYIWLNIISSTQHFSDIQNLFFVNVIAGGKKKLKKYTTLAVMQPVISNVSKCT